MLTPDDRERIKILKIDNIITANFPIKPGHVITRKREARGRNAVRWTAVVTKVTSYGGSDNAAALTLTVYERGRISIYGGSSIMACTKDYGGYEDNLYMEMLGKDIKIIGKVNPDNLPTKLNKKTILPL